MEKETFGQVLRRLRKNAEMSLAELGEKIGMTPQGLSLIETGRNGVERDPTLVGRLESALGLSPGTLAQHLPEGHVARRLAASIEIPIIGYVGAGPACADAADPEERLGVGEAFAGCVAYRVRGDSMNSEMIQNGDYIIVRADPSPQPGEIVVAWIEELEGCVCKKLTRSNRLVSDNNWSHRLTDSDRIYGAMVAVVRITSKLYRHA